MPVDSKTTTSWEHTYTDEDGSTITVSGTQGLDCVQVRIYNPATGWGMNETPSSSGFMSMTCADWSKLINLIGIK